MKEKKEEKEKEMPKLSTTQLWTANNLGDYGPRHVAPTKSCSQQANRFLVQDQVHNLH